MDMEYRNVPTTCPYCGAGCGLNLQVLDGRIVGVLPAKPHPISDGKLCIKGWNAAQFVHHPDRLTRPLVRKEGVLVETGWDEALSLVAQRLGAIRDESGPGAIGMLSSAKCTNEENYLFQKLSRAVIGTNNVDHCARLCHASSVAGLAAAFGSGAMTNSIPELETDTNCFLVVGSNTSETHPLIASRIYKARDRGAKLVVIDPRGTQVARMADLHLNLLPGTDVAVINGLMHVILEEGLADETFIRERTEGFEEVRKLVSRYSPEVVEKISGVPAADLRRAAIMYGSFKPAAILYAMGITQHTTGTDNVKSMANLAMLTGNLGIPGGGLNPLRGQNNVQGACDVGALPNVYPGYQSVADPAVREKFIAAWGPKDLDAVPGKTVTEMIDALGSGTMRALYVMAENMLVSDPDTNHVRSCLEKAEFLVVQEIFLSETAQLADVVLPGASFAEKDGSFTNTDRRVQPVRKAIAPPGSAKADWEIICDLARRMGAKGFDFASPADIMAELASVTPIYGGISLERLARLGCLQWPCPSAEHPGTAILHREKFTRGLGKFHAVEFKAAAELPDEEYPFMLSTGRTMFHFHTGTMTRRSRKLHQEMPTAYVEIHPVDAARIGLGELRQVRLRSRRGQIVVAVRITERIRPGLVFMPFHFVEAAANVLTNGALDPIAKIPELKVCAVQVEPATPKEGE